MNNWNSYKLSEITELIMGQSPPSSSYVAHGQGTPFIQGRGDFTEMYVSPSMGTVSPTKIAPSDSILMSVRAPVGDVNINADPICIGRGIASIVPSNSVNKEYLYYYLKSKKEEISDLGYGSIFKAINKSQLQDVEILLPALKTQKTIGYILSTLIDKNTILKKRLIHYKQLKQSLLQNYFSQNNIENVLKKEIIGNLCKFNYGKGLPEKSRILGDINVYGSNGIVGKNSYSLVKEEGIIIGRKGTVGAVHYSKEPFFPIDTTYYVTNKDTKLNLKYLYYLLSYVKLNRLRADVGVPGLNREMAYKEPVLYVENAKVQKRIADILTIVDYKLYLLQKRVNFYTELFNTILSRIMNQEIDVSNLEFENA